MSAFFYVILAKTRRLCRRSLSHSSCSAVSSTRKKEIMLQGRIRQMIRSVSNFSYSGMTLRFRSGTPTPISRFLSSEACGSIPLQKASHTFRYLVSVHNIDYFVENLYKI